MTNKDYSSDQQLDEILSFIDSTGDWEEAKAALQALLVEARYDEMEMAHKAWLTTSLVDHMNNRIVELKARIKALK